MTRLRETVYAAVYSDHFGEFILHSTIASNPQQADNLDADYRKHVHDPEHCDYQRIGKFRIEECVWGDSDDLDKD